MRSRHILLLLLVTAQSAMADVIPDAIIEQPTYHAATQALLRWVGQGNFNAIRDSLSRLTAEKGLKLLQGNFGSVSQDADFSISFNDARYQASWSKNGSTLCRCTFPADVELLRGKNRIALEQELYDRFSSVDLTSVGNGKMTVRKGEGLKPIPLSPYMVDDKGFYISPKLKHQVFYAPVAEESDCYKLLHDKSRYTLETISNVMLTGESPEKLLLNLTMSMYHGNQTVRIPLKALFRILSQEYSKPYFGIEEYDGKFVEASCIWVNEAEGFNHILWVRFPIAALSDSNVEIEARMYPYVPTHNVKSLFDELTES